MNGNDQKQIKFKLNKITGILDKLIEEKERDLAGHRKLNELFKVVHDNFKPGKMGELDHLKLQTKFMDIENISKSIPGTVNKQGELYTEYTKISREILKLAGAV